MEEYVYMKNEKATLFWTRFWRWGIIIVVLFNLCVIPLICKLFDISIPVGSILFATGIGCPMVAMGFDYTLAIIFKWPHILLVNQSASHHKMNTYHLKWNDINKKEFIFIGVFFLIFGHAIIVVGIINCINYL